jgi:hypothetical protein
MNNVPNFRDPILSLDKTSFSSSVSYANSLIINNGTRTLVLSNTVPRCFDSKLNHGLLYRGGTPDDATDLDIKRFIEMDIRTIIDLRSG